MTIDKMFIMELEHTYRKSFPEELRQYLLMKYEEEAFPYEFTEQDLYANIKQDISEYEIGKLDVTIKSPSERWQDEREYLRKLYIDKYFETRELEDYIAELEHMLSEHGLKSSGMTKQRIEY
ncbi:hypothetical protein [Petroclostridium sp. X23]|uniref:hypothetical protein n=1 Tax=Petroclostridium sp. X23 TaxID=3045146 RepID=UPI0024AD20FB|nr:hypothetical protein [Petroclostridium sp. X23]WHH57738.1 hypothetical protein QKW49_18190 [Petroclostridium sp. X23]